MKPPCDQAFIESTASLTPCSKSAEPWILAVAIVGSSMAFIDSTVVNVALPAIQSSLGGTVADVQWVVETYALLLSALILTGGALGDVYGRKRMFLLGVTIFAAASVGCGLAANIRELMVARAVQGFGAAFLVPGSLSTISAAFDESRRGAAIGTWSGFTSITSAAGPVLGGWLIEHGSWRWAFFLNVPLAIAVIALAFWRVPESKAPASRPVDWLGAILVTIGLTGVTYGFIESSSKGWTNIGVYGTLFVGGATLICFRYFEKSASSPMVPFELFRSSDFAGANLMTLFLYAAMGIFFFLYPLNLIQVQNYSATLTAAASLPFILPTFLLSRWSGGLVGRFGAKRPLVIGPVIAAAGFVCFAFPPTGDSYWGTFFPGFLVLGVGMAISVAPLTTVVMDAVDQDLAGAASGINNAVARTASLLAIAVLGALMVTLFSNYVDDHLAEASLPVDLAHQVQSSEIGLAAISLPKGLDFDVADRARSLITDAFIFGFRRIMLICALFSATSSILAWRMIGGPKTTPSSLPD